MRNGEARRFSVMTMRAEDEKASESRYQTLELAMEHAARAIASQRYEWVHVAELVSRPVLSWKLGDPGFAELGGV